ncbi:MAG: prolyl oligopeptidase family serine peptidase [Gammaproteobacteria bacterium]
MNPVATVSIGCAAMLVVAMAWPGPAAAAVTPAFTIEQVMSAPFPSSLVAAPAQGRFAWVFNERGSRNVWIADPAAKGSYDSRAITAYAGDDGFDLGELAWDAKGETLMFTRGGSLEGGGPVNVTSQPTGAPPQQIWAVTVGQPTVRKLATGHSAVPAPNDERVAYLVDGQIWVTALDASAKPRQLLHDRGFDSQLHWSPDGSRLAFVSGRKDHSFIGVYDFGRDAITWLTPSVDGDGAIAWAPDGLNIAFIRVPTHLALSEFQREAEPWAIWLADARTGRGREIWKAQKGAGSNFSPSQSADNLLWADGGRLIFPWERSGWRHLYSISTQGGEPTQLTPGQFEVFRFELSRDRRRIVYCANQDDLDHRHLWSIAPAGGPPIQLTRGDTIEDLAVIGGDSRSVAALHSDGRRPLRPAVVAAKGQVQDLAPASLPQEFPIDKLVVPEQVVFRSPDGLSIHGQLFAAHLKKGERRPAVLFFHGGPTRQMLLGWHPLDAYSYSYAMNQYLAAQGYIVLSVNYRGGIGYGTEFRLPDKFAFAGASELNDIKGAAYYLRERADVDPKRIGIWGPSYGGLMTALGLSRASDLLAAGVDYAGVSDWSGLMSSNMELSAPDASQEQMRLAFQSSALASMDTWRSPVLLIHADDDRNVPFAQTVDQVRALRRHGIPFEQIVIPDEIHDLLLYRSWIMLFHATDDFFDRKLYNLSSPAH